MFPLLRTRLSRINYSFDSTLNDVRKHDATDLSIVMFNLRSYGELLIFLFFCCLSRRNNKFTLNYTRQIFQGKCLRPTQSRDSKLGIFLDALSISSSDTHIFSRRFFNLRPGYKFLPLISKHLLAYLDTIGSSRFIPNLERALCMVATTTCFLLRFPILRDRGNDPKFDLPVTSAQYA